MAASSTSAPTATLSKQDVAVTARRFRTLAGALGAARL
jgi:hypothetical protein